MTDSLLYDSAKVSKIFIPLDPNNQSASFVLKVQENMDTLNIFYRSTFYLVSYTCGFSNNFTVDYINYTKHNLNSIEILNEDVFAEDTETGEHIRVYF